MIELMKSPAFWIGYYYLIGIVVYWLTPMTPRAKEAFDQARGIHKHGDILVVVMVATFWPVIASAVLVRFLFGRSRK